ncbi:MAG: cytochrome C oxidase subunit IV family protein [Chloroflexota bacterium]|nr:cytochrome C oxidase subunit IV family protein [Chloroflexota bacterium]
MAHITDPIQRDHEEHHVIPPRNYVIVFGLLVVLTILTVLAANFQFGGLLNEVVALGIATMKASLVILFFMHVRYSTPLLRLVVAAGFIFFGIMVLFTMADFVSRDWRSTPPRQIVAPVEQAPPPVTEPTLGPQPTQAVGQDEVRPRGTVNPGR